MYTRPYKTYNIVNAPFFCVRQKRLDSLVPQNLAEDPYTGATAVTAGAAARIARSRCQNHNEYQASRVDADATLSVAKSSTARSSSPSTEQMNRSIADSFKVCSAHSDWCAIFIQPK